MTLRLQVALAATLLLAATGCENTGADTEAIISGELGIRVTTGSLMAATLATELALAVTETPEPGACPFASQDGDDLTLDFGTGCVPDSGTTTEPMAFDSYFQKAAGNSDRFVAVTDPGSPLDELASEREFFAFRVGE